MTQDVKNYANMTDDDLRSQFEEKQGRGSYKVTVGGNERYYTGAELDTIGRAYRSKLSDDTYARTAFESYTDSDFDKYAYDHKLPSLKLWNSVEKYAAGGGIKENYGSLKDDQWKKINELWQQDWEYGLTDADAQRKALGLAPVSYDDMYEDTLLDAELKANGLPPSKLLNGKLGETYNAWMKNAQQYDDFCADVVRAMREGQNQKVEDTGSIAGNAVAQYKQSKYSLEEAYKKVLADPKWATFVSEHGYDMPDFPKEDDPKYLVKDEYGNPLYDDNGEKVYDTTKWNEDYFKELKKQAKINNDEFAISFDKVQQYYDEHAQDVIIRDEAINWLNAQGVNPYEASEAQAKDAVSYGIGQAADELTLETAFDGKNLTDYEKTIYQPVINKYNNILKTKGYNEAQAYWGSDEFKADIHATINENIVSTYRQTHQTTPYALKNAGATLKTDDEILTDYYTSVASDYLIDDTEIINKLKTGEMSIGDYVLTICTDAESSRTYAHDRLVKKLEELGLPTTKEEIEKLIETKRTEQSFAADDPLSDDFKAVSAELEKLNGVLRDLEATEISYYAEALSYTSAFDEWEKRVGEQYINDTFDMIVESYAKTNTEEQAKELAEHATDDDKRRLVYLYDTEGTRTERQSSIVNDSETGMSDYAFDNVTVLSEDADKYLNKVLLHDWDSIERNEKLEATGWLGSKSDSAFVRWGGGALNTIANIPMTIVEGVYNLAADTATLLRGNEMLSSARWTTFSDTQANIAQHISEGWSGEVGAFIYQLVPSMAQSGASMWLALATGGASEAFTLALMGTQSYSQAVDSALRQGATGEQAYMLGLMNGAAEIFFEKVSLDEFVNNVNVVTDAITAAGKSGKYTNKELTRQFFKGMMKNGVRQGLVEGSEEVFTSLANILSDGVILGYNSSFNQAVARYMESGLTEKDAREKAGLSIVNDVIMDFLGGFVSGAIMANIGDVAMSRTSTEYQMARLMNKQHNLSAITDTEALEIAKKAALRDSNQKITKDGAQNIVNQLKAKGADSATISYVLSEMNDEMAGEDAFGVFDNAIIDTRASESKALAEEIKKTVKRGVGKISGEAAQAKINYIESETNKYLSSLSQTLQTADRTNISKAVADVQNGLLDLVRRESGISYNEGMKVVSEYMRTIPADELASGSVPFVAAMKLGSANRVSSREAAHYSAYAYALTKMASDANFTEAFSSVFGEHTKDVATNVRNACLKSAKGGTIGFVDVALSSIGMYESMGDGHFAKTLGNKMDSKAFIPAVLATCEASPNKSNSRLFYDYVMKHGVTASVLDAMTVAKYYDDMPEDSRTRANKYVEKSVDAFMTSEELQTESDTVASAEQNVDSKQAVVQAQKDSNAQTEATSNNVVARHSATYDAITASETVVIDGKVYQTTAAELAEAAESVRAALNDAINARDNLAKQNEKRLESAEQDLAQAEQKLKNARTQYKKKLNRHVAAYMNMIGAQLETMRNGDVVSNAEFDRITALAAYGLREDLNNAVTKIIAAEKRQAQAFAYQIGATMQIADFTNEKFANEHKVKGEDLNTFGERAGFEQNGRIYLNEKAFGTNRGARVGYGVDAVILHELSHVAEKSAKNWQAYSKYAVQYMLDNYGKRAEGFLKKHGVSELTAEFSRLELLQNPNLIRDLCEHAPTMAMRMHQWLHNVNAAITNSLRGSSKYAKAERDFALALGLANEQVKSESATQTQKQATRDATDNVRNLVEANPDAVAKPNAKTNKLAASTQMTDDTYVPEAPPEDTSIAYGYEADDAKGFTDINSGSGWTLAYDASRGGSLRTGSPNATTTNRKLAPWQRRSWRPGEYDFTKSWPDQVADVAALANGEDSRPMHDNMLLGRTTDIMRKIGFAQIPMLYTEKHTEQNLYGKQDGSDPLDHLLDRVDLNELYKAIQNPIAVIIASDDPTETPEKLAERVDQRSRSERSVVMYVDVKSKSGERVIVPITVDANGMINNKRVDAHILTSVHGRQTGIGQLARAFVEEANGNPSVLYWNKNKVQKAIAGENDIRNNGKRKRKDGSTVTKRLQLPNRLPTTSFPHSILDNDIPVKPRIKSQTDTMQFQRFAGENPQYVEQDGELFVKSKDGKQLKSMNEDTNYALFDRAIDDPNYFTDFTAEDYDDEYMELAEKYIAGTATQEDVARLRDLVDAAASAKGVIMADRNRPLNLYHGTPPWRGFGFTRFEGNNREDQKNLTFTATNPNVAYSYTANMGGIPHTREIRSAGKLNIDNLAQRKGNDSYVSFNDYIELGNELGKSPYDLLREDLRQVFGDIKVSFNGENSDLQHTDDTAARAMSEIGKTIHQYSDAAKGEPFYNVWSVIDEIREKGANTPGVNVSEDDWDDFISILDSLMETADAVSVTTSQYDVAISEEQARETIKELTDWYNGRYNNVAEDDAYDDYDNPYAEEEVPGMEEAEIGPVDTLDYILGHLVNTFTDEDINALKNSRDQQLRELGQLLDSGVLTSIVVDLENIARGSADERAIVEVKYADNPVSKISIDQLVTYLDENRGGGMYGLYGRQTENPYEFDLEGGDWANIENRAGDVGLYWKDRSEAASVSGLRKIMSGEINKADFAGLDAVNTTNTNAEYARRRGYSMARFNNLTDSDKPTMNSHEYTDDLIFFNQDGMKSSDLVTLDENGIVPLSKRFDWSDPDIRHYTELKDDINSMTESDRARFGNPRLMGGANGLLVVRNVSFDGFMRRDPSVEGARNIAILERAPKYANGNASLMISPIELKDCAAVVCPTGIEFADVRNAAYENGATVEQYDLSEPSMFDDAIETAARNDGDIHYFSEGFDSYIEQYGAYDEENTRRAGGRLVPQRTSNRNRVHRTMHTLANSQYTTNEQYENDIKRYVESGAASYEPVSNRRTLDKARSNINRLGGAKNALVQLNSDVATDQGKNTDLLAMAEAIYMDSDAMQNFTEEEREQLLTDICLIAEDSGRSLQLIRELNNMTNAGHINQMEQTGKRMASKYEQRTNTPTELTLTDEERQAYLNAKTKEEIDAIDDQVSKRWAAQTRDLPLLDRIRNWRYFSMLGNPRTHFRNMVGNALMYPIARTKDAINAGYQRLFGIDQADRTTTGWTRPLDAATKAYVDRETKIAIPIMQNASMKYYQSAKKVDLDNRSGFAKFIEEATRDVPSAHISNSNRLFGRAVNKASSINANLLEMEDALALGMRFRTALAQQLQAKKLDASNIPEWQHKLMVQYAMEEALRATFRDASALADAINKFENSGKFAKFVVGSLLPFKKTPINIAKRGVEYSPIGLVHSICKMIANRHWYNTKKSAIENSNMSKAGKDFRMSELESAFKKERIAAIDKLSQGTTGSILFGIGMLAAKLGWVSIGRKDDDQAAFETALGKNSYSLNIGDVSIDLSAFSPAAIPLLMGTAAEEAFDPERMDETLVPSMITALTETLDPITEMSMLSGIADAMSGMSYSNQDDAKNTQWWGTLARNAATSYIGQFIPTSVGQLARMTDPYARSYSAGEDYWASKALGSEWGSKIKSLQNKLPFVAWLSEPKVDLHGNPVGNYTNWGDGVWTILNNTILPATIKFDRKNEVDDELVRLYGVVDSADIFPTKPSRTIGSYTDKDGHSVTIKLQNDAEYNQYQMEVGQVTYDALAGLISSRSYANMTDVQKADAIEKVVKDARKNVKSLWKAKKRK